MTRDPELPGASQLSQPFFVYSKRVLWYSTQSLEFRMLIAVCVSITCTAVGVKCDVDGNVVDLYGLPHLVKRHVTANIQSRQATINPSKKILH